MLIFCKASFVIGFNIIIQPGHSHVINDDFIADFIDEVGSGRDKIVCLLLNTYVEIIVVTYLSLYM